MQVAKLTAIDGQSFLTNKQMTADEVQSFAKRVGGLRQIDLIEMTEAEYFAIPATNESAAAFGQG
jgi:hypothetical protein